MSVGDALQGVVSPRRRRGQARGLAFPHQPGHSSPRPDPAAHAYDQIRRGVAYIRKETATRSLRRYIASRRTAGVKGISQELTPSHRPTAFEGIDLDQAPGEVLLGPLAHNRRRTISVPDWTFRRGQGEASHPYQRWTSLPSTRFGERETLAPMSRGSLQPGAIIGGDFKVIRSLSAGGMGEVYLTEQISTGRERALKVMLGAIADSRDFRRRFEQEAKIGALIESEHVVEVVAAGVDGPTGAAFLAMELLKGKDLEAYLGEVGHITAAGALALFEQLTHAVGAAHERGIVHRDLKPENLFLTQRLGAKTALDVANGQFVLKVLDFGIAKLIDQARTSATGAMGTPAWMAPEQAQHGSAIKPAADVWAMGLIAFRILSGRVYWKSASDPDASALMIPREVAMDPIAPASQRTAELGGLPLPDGFDAWFARCVERDPTCRFDNATQMFEALSATLSNATPRSVQREHKHQLGPMPGRTEIASVPVQPAPPVVGKRRARIPYAILGTAVFLAGIVIVIVVGKRSGSSLSASSVTVTSQTSAIVASSPKSVIPPPKANKRYVDGLEWRGPLSDALSLLSRGEAQRASGAVAALREKYGHAVLKSLASHLEAATATENECKLTGLARPRSQDLQTTPTQRFSASEVTIVATLRGALVAWTQPRSAQDQATTVSVIPLDLDLWPSDHQSDAAPETLRALSPHLISTDSGFLMSWVAAGKENTVHARYLSETGLIASAATRLGSGDGIGWVRSMTTPDDRFAFMWAAETGAQYTKALAFTTAGVVRGTPSRDLVVEKESLGRWDDIPVEIHPLAFGLGPDAFALISLETSQEANLVASHFPDLVSGHGQTVRHKLTSPPPTLACSAAHCLSSPATGGLTIYTFSRAESPREKPVRSMGHAGAVAEMGTKTQLVWFEDDGSIATGALSGSTVEKSTIGRVAKRPASSVLVPGPREGEWYFAFLDDEDGVSELYVSRFQCARTP